MSSWLALQDEVDVNEIRLCISVKDEIREDRLPPDTAARSAKLFYLLSQSLAKWKRGLELLRSCSKKRQSMSATGHEAVRTLHLNYSIVSQMGSRLRERRLHEIACPVFGAQKAHGHGGRNRQGGDQVEQLSRVEALRSRSLFHPAAGRFTSGETVCGAARQRQQLE